MFSLQSSAPDLSSLVFYFQSLTKTTEIKVFFADSGIIRVEMFMIEWTEFHDVRILFFSKVGGSDFDLKKFSSDYVISESVYL